jgi:hypothetical protein
MCPYHPSWEPGRLTKVLDGPQVLALNVFWLQERVAQVRMPSWGQGFTPTENVGRGLLLQSTLPTQTCGRKLHRGWWRPTGLMVSFMIFTVSVRNILDTSLYMQWTVWYLKCCISVYAMSNYDHIYINSGWPQVTLGIYSAPNCFKKKWLFSLY